MLYNPFIISNLYCRYIFFIETILFSLTYQKQVIVSDLKMSKFPGASTTRKKTEIFLIGQSESSLPSNGKLPLTSDVMKYFFYRRNLPEFKSRPPSSAVCCPLKTKSQDASCFELGGCCSEGQGEGTKCVVAKVKCSWLMSGLPVIKDQNITRKILKIFERHRTLVKSKSKLTKCEDQKREAFKEEMSSLFDISAADVVAQINKDRLRSEEAKTEDLSFLDDQKGARKMSIGNRDKDYDDSVASKFVRDSRLARVEMVAGGSQGSTDEHGGKVVMSVKMIVMEGVVIVTLFLLTLRIKHPKGLLLLIYLSQPKNLPSLHLLLLKGISLVLELSQIF